MGAFSERTARARRDDVLGEVKLGGRVFGGWRSWRGGL